MKQNWYRLGLLVSALVAAPVASADHSRHASQPGFVDYATVVDVEPIVKYVRVSTPREECWDEQVPVRQASYTSGTPTIVGGIIGGVLGRRVVRSHRDWGTAAGALLGGSIGRDIYNQRRQDSGYYMTTRTRCTEVADYHEEERIEGYRVTYRYRGETFTTRTDQDPGDQIRVRVAVNPVY
jgi:uncharacterized protein YcfJ